MSARIEPCGKLLTPTLSLSDRECKYNSYMLFGFFSSAFCSRDIHNEENVPCFLHSFFVFKKLA